MRSWTRRPFSVLKYAMTLDGKIATAHGHAAWVSSAESRAQVGDFAPPLPTHHPRLFPLSLLANISESPVHCMGTAGQFRA